MQTKQNDKYYVIDADTKCYYDEFSTMEDAVAAIKEFIDEDFEEHNLVFYAIQHAGVLYDEKGNAK